MNKDSLKSKPFLTKKIYYEIFNNGIQELDLLDDILSKGGATLYKKLSPKLDYIVFKDGSYKTLKYAHENKIKIVNPLWVNDKINGINESDDKYTIKKTITEFLLDSKQKENEKELKKLLNKKRKNDIDMNTTITKFFKVISR